MATVIEQAAKGKRKAMDLLYRANKQKVYYIALCLADNRGVAIEATNYAFKNVWSNIHAHGVTTTADFTHLVIRKAVEYCKKKTNKKDAKAFRTPSKKNFLITGDVEDIDEGKVIPELVLRGLPELQRYILVLHTVGEYLPEQIASTFKFDMKTVRMILEAEETNVERLLRHLPPNTLTYDSVIKAIRAEELITEVHESINQYVTSVIDNIAAPIEKKQKKRNVIVCTVVLVVCLLIGGIAMIMVNNSGNQSGVDDTATSETSYTDSVYVE